MICLELFWTFFKIGAFTFGGGYAMLPLITEQVAVHNWLDAQSLINFVAVSESTPGPIMVNLATYVGSSQGGMLGAAIASLAVVLPSFCIILLILVLMRSIIKNPNVQAVLRGMQPCVVGIILATGIRLTLKACVPAGNMEIKAMIIALILGAAAVSGKKFLKKKLSAIQLILISAVLGILFYGI